MHRDWKKIHARVEDSETETAVKRLRYSVALSVPFTLFRQYEVIPLLDEILFASCDISQPFIFGSLLRLFFFLPV
jgi:hypothetical protein